MREFVRFEGGGSAVVVEVEEPDSSSGLVRVSRRPGESFVSTSRSFAEVVSGVRPAVEALVQSIQELDAAPETVEVTFGLKLTFSAGAVIASTSGEGNFQVRLTWSRDDSAR